MKRLQFTVKIKANKHTVWNTLWQDETFRDWAGIIDPGTHLVGELQEGREIQYISGNGYGVTSLVEKLDVNSYLLLKHRADTQEYGEQERDPEWTGGDESYSLTYKDDTTILTTIFDVPPELEDYFKTSYPKALEQVKILAEQSNS